MNQACLKHGIVAMVKREAVRWWLWCLPVLTFACGGSSNGSPSSPTAASVATFLPAPTGTDCPARLRAFPNCLSAVSGNSLVLESVSPAPPARLAFGRSVTARLRYTSTLSEVTIHFQPSTIAGCAGYNFQLGGAAVTLPAGSGTVDRTFTISSGSLLGCGQTEVRVINGEYYVELVRLLIGSPGGLLFEQYLLAEYRFGP